MKKIQIIFLLQLSMLWQIGLAAHTDIDMPGQKSVLYQKIGDIGRNKSIVCILPEYKGQKSVVSYVPTTGFFKGYKQRLVITRESDDTYSLSMQKKGELKEIAGRFCLAANNLLHMKIDPFGDIYFQKLDRKNKEENINITKERKNKIVRIAQVMSS